MYAVTRELSPVPSEFSLFTSSNNEEIIHDTVRGRRWGGGGREIKELPELQWGAQFRLQCSFRADPSSKYLNPLKLSIDHSHILNDLLGITWRTYWTNSSTSAECLWGLYTKEKQICHLHMFLKCVGPLHA